MDDKTIETRKPPKISDYLTIGQAAKRLGVCPNTIRNWEKAKKIKTRRHPLNKYRLYKLSELEAILKRIRSKCD
jgi:DNA-binding transcriptional MerR regulator